MSQRAAQVIQLGQSMTHRSLIELKRNKWNRSDVVNTDIRKLQTIHVGLASELHTEEKSKLMCSRSTAAVCKLAER